MKNIINKSVHLLIIALAHLLINSSIFAQVPQKMSYQAVIRNSNDSLLISTPVGMRISLVQSSPTGTVVFSETQTATTNANGLVSLQIGMGTAVSGTFAGIDWAAGPYYVKTETDLSGGTNYTITSSNELLSVPYALFSANGTPGPQGPQGIAGTNGNDGATGPQGPIGLTGPQGPQGIAGTNGNDGATGAQGPIGLTGPQGIAGTNGNDGATGAQGPIGLTGPQGPAGNDGAVGATGATGPQGIAGTNGNDGATGPQGIQGLIGATGLQGPQGVAGTNGSSAYQVAVANGFIGTEAQWLLSLKGLTGAIGAAGTNGTNGATGATGPVGPIGLTGATGTPGAQGPQGVQGPAGPQGPIGLTGPAGTNGNSLPNGNSTGDLLSWNGTQWVAISNSAVATNSNIPQVTTGFINLFYCNSSTVNSDAGFSITAKGICWSLSPNPSLADNFSSDGQGMGSYNSLFHNLLLGQTYYFRAYATNSMGTGYGMTYVFIPNGNEIISITTTAATNISGNNALSGGSISSIIPSYYGLTFIDRGIVWGTSPNPTKTSNTGMLTNGSGTGTFTNMLSGLTPNTTYYVRAWASNSYSNSILYGTQETFTTGYITTTEASAITTSSAISGGTITNPPGNPILAKGVVWSTSQNPTVSLATKTMDGTSNGDFNSSITGLSLGSTYFVRAYVTNSLGTSYGNTITVRPASLPSITTTALTNITLNSADCGGGSITNGGSGILEKGVVWSTNPNPTTALTTKTSNGTLNSSFSSSITNLMYNTTYYVRAYVRNQIGTTYGEELVFTTLNIQVGSSHQGGIIAYILQEGDPGYVAGEIHGLIRSGDLGYFEWGCMNSLLSTTSTDFGAGESNTIEIVNNCSGNTAAKYCNDLIENGYNDWFLPSLNELNRFPAGYFSQKAYSTSSELSETQYYSYGQYINTYNWNSWYNIASFLQNKNSLYAPGTMIYTVAVRKF